jgi:hypothetical protein
MNPNHYLLKHVYEIPNMLKRKIMEDDIPEETKDLYLGILDNPDKLENMYEKKEDDDKFSFTFSDDGVMDSINGSAMNGLSGMIHMRNSTADSDDEIDIDKLKSEELYNLDFPEYKLYKNENLMRNFEKINVGLTFY